MKNELKMMSMILLAIIGTLVGLGPLVLMASVRTVKDHNMGAFLTARRKLEAATNALEKAMAGVDKDRSGPDKVVQRQIISLYHDYKSFGALVKKTDPMFVKPTYRHWGPRFPNAAYGADLKNGFCYNHKAWFKRAKTTLARASQWVADHVGNYVECDTCGATGVSGSDHCPQTNQPMLQTDQQGPDVSRDRNVMEYDEDGNPIAMEIVSEMVPSYVAQGSNHQGKLALEWAAGRYLPEVIGIARAFRSSNPLDRLVNQYEPVNPATL